MINFIFTQFYEIFIQSEDNYNLDDDPPIPGHLVCPVCLDMLFSPFTVKPCGHVFCEPCLRRLAHPAPTNTPCPLCRELIGLCQPCPGKKNFPFVWMLEIFQFDKNNK